VTGNYFVQAVIANLKSYLTFSTTSTSLQRLVLLNGRVYHIPDTAFVLVVMRMQLTRLFYEFSIDRVLYFSFDGNSDGLGHPVTGYHPDPGLS
jgi:hypothetical protein